MQITLNDVVYGIIVFNLIGAGVLFIASALGKNMEPFDVLD